MCRLLLCVRRGLPALVMVILALLIVIPVTQAQEPAPSKPQLLLPPPSFTTSSSHPTLKWRAVEGANYYQIQVAKSNQFSASEQEARVVDGTFFTTATLPNGTYYWRVRAVFNGNYIGPWSSPAQFMVNTSLPQEPEWMGETYLSQPHFDVPNGAPSGQIVINEVCTEFCNGTSRDTVELYNAGPTSVNITNWRLTLYDSNTLVIDYYFPSFTLLPGSYVSVVEGAGLDTANTVYLGANVNIPYVADSTGAIMLRSTAPTGIDFVRFRSNWPYDVNSTVAPPAGTTWIAPDPLSNQSNNSFGRDLFSLDTNKGSDWSQPQFDTINAVNSPPLPTSKPTTAPVQLAPAANASTNDDGITFRWGAVANAEYYRIELHTNATCTSLFNWATPIALSIDDIFTDGVYYWRVRAENGWGYGLWSSCRKWTKDTLSPSFAPSLVSPVGGIALTTQKPPLKWTAVPEAARYEVALEYGDGTNPETIAIVTTTSYTVANPLQPSVGVAYFYYWRVRALDAAGNAGPWSSFGLFDITSTTTAAPDLYYFTTNMPVVSWAPVSWANGYQIEVDDVSTFTSPEYVNYDVSRIQQSWTVGPLPTDGKYYWRIRAKRDDGTWGPWSKVQSFVIRY